MKRRIILLFIIIDLIVNIIPFNFILEGIDSNIYTEIIDNRDILLYYFTMSFLPINIIEGLLKKVNYCIDSCCKGKDDRGRKRNNDIEGNSSYLVQTYQKNLLEIMKLYLIKNIDVYIKEMRSLENLRYEIYKSYIRNHIKFSLLFIIQIFLLLIIPRSNIDMAKNINIKNIIYAQPIELGFFIFDLKISNNRGVLL